MTVHKSTSKVFSLHAATALGRSPTTHSAKGLLLKNESSRARHVQSASYSHRRAGLVRSSTVASYISKARRVRLLAKALAAPMELQVDALDHHRLSLASDALTSDITDVQSKFNSAVRHASEYLSHRSRARPLFHRPYSYLVLTPFD